MKSALLIAAVAALSAPAFAQSGAGKRTTFAPVRPAMPAPVDDPRAIAAADAAAASDIAPPRPMADAVTTTAVPPSRISPPSAAMPITEAGHPST